MIKSFRSKGLAELWSTNSSSKIDAKFYRRLLLRLDALDAAVRPADMNLPGFDFHALKGFEPVRYTIHVNGPWTLTFAFEPDGAVAIDFEQYH
ncbi:MAG: plasmid maintenance system killer [Devosia sp.]|nr:plasmid maintenance system killer [Devosia sp.]